MLCVLIKGMLGDSNEYIQYSTFNIKNKITLDYPISASVGLFQATRERVRNSNGKRAISVRATEGYCKLLTITCNTSCTMLR